MEKVSRRSAMRATAAGTVAVGTAVLGGTAAGDGEGSQTVDPGGRTEGPPEVPLPLLHRAPRRPVVRVVRVRPRPRSGPTGPRQTLRLRPSPRRAGNRTPRRRNQGEPLPVSSGVDPVHGCPRGRGAEITTSSPGHSQGPRRNAEEAGGPQGQTASCGSPSKRVAMCPEHAGKSLNLQGEERRPDARNPLAGSPRRGDVRRFRDGSPGCRASGSSERRSRTWSRTTASSPPATHSAS